MRTLRALALAAVLTVSTGTAAFAGDGGSYAQPARPTHETFQGDGGSYAQPARPARESILGDGGSYAVPVEPTEIRDGEVWA